MYSISKLELTIKLQQQVIEFTELMNRQQEELDSGDFNDRGECEEFIGYYSGRIEQIKEMLAALTNLSI